jgi:CTP:molybdopterin cytidylyltransferase MocA
MTETAGLVLAAGEGRRFGGPKAPYVLDGVRLVDRSVALLRDAGCDPVLVVLGAWIGDVPDAVVVVNDDWPSGMGSSLRAGLAALSSYDEVDRVVVTLVDLPGLTVPAVTRLLEATSVRDAPSAADAAAAQDDAASAQDDRSARDDLKVREVLAATTYDGVRGHPVLLGRAHWDGVGEAATGDQGARSYLATHEHTLTLVEVADLATGEDLDKPPPPREVLDL